VTDTRQTVDLQKSMIPSRVITLEEHFTTPAFLRATSGFTPAPARSAALDAKLLNLGADRIAAMDEGGIDLQILSLAATGQESLAADQATALVREANDIAFAATEAYPRRLGCFTSLALGNPDAAAAELERGVNRLRSVGGFLNGTEGGSFLDDPRYTPIFEAAQSLDVPLYLHPSPPRAAIRDAYFSSLPEDTAYFLSTAAWGWHAELGLHCIRLIVSGLFDRFPKLRIIIGHMGEDLPFSILRAQDGLPKSITHLPRTISQYFLDHFVVTTSGYFTQPPFDCAMSVLGADRILYSVDYPYRSNTSGLQFLAGVNSSRIDFEKIAHENAERILKLPSNTDYLNKT
jgi:predicted TIM-barrel fold metal-dependent hydrolase